MKRSVQAVFAAVVAAGIALPIGQPAAAQPTRRYSGWPVTVTVQTVPVLAHVRFTWDGQRAVTDSAGRVSFTSPHNFFGHSLALVDTAINTPTRRYRFVRWAGQRDPVQAFRTTVTGLPMRANYTITAAFSVQYPVTVRFVDQTGTPIELSRISAATVRGDDKRDVGVALTGATWLDGSMPTYQKSVLSSADVAYSLQSVTIDQVNAVDIGRLRFTPGTTPVMTFAVAFHDLVVTSRDLVFGPGMGSAARVTGSDGTTRSVPFAPDGTARLTNLPKGQYDVDIVGPGGVVMPRRVNLSRDQTVEVTVIGWADLVTGGLLGILVAFGLVFIGRSWWRGFPRRRPYRLAFWLYLSNVSK